MWSDGGQLAGAWLRIGPVISEMDTSGGITFPLSGRKWGPGQAVPQVAPPARCEVLLTRVLSHAGVNSFELSVSAGALVASRRSAGAFLLPQDPPRGPRATRWRDFRAGRQIG